MSGMGCEYQYNIYENKGMKCEDMMFFHKTNWQILKSIIVAFANCNYFL